MNRYKLCQEAIWRLDKLSEKIMNYQKKPHTYGDNAKLYMKQMHVLSIIGRNPNINIKDLAQLTDKSQPTISQQITRLEKLGFITKLRKQENQREIVINLTEKGNRAFAYHEAHDNNFYKLVIDELSQFTEEELIIVNKFIKATENAFDFEDANKNK